MKDIIQYLLEKATTLDIKYLSYIEEYKTTNLEIFDINYQTSYLILKPRLY